MARFGFIGSTYTSQSVNADCQRCVNWYPESDESGAGKSSLVLYPTPGLRLAYQLSGSSVRGFCIINSRVFALSGTTLYELFSNGTTINRGAVVNDGQMASMAASTTQLLVASGGNTYVLTLATNVLTQIPPATFTFPFTGANAPIVQVGFSDGFFIALVNGSNNWYVSGTLNANDWTTNGSTIVSVFPDNVVGMIVDHREIALGGLKSSVVYYDSGNLFPYDVIPGGFIEQGLVAKWSMAKLDNSIFWLGGDERGNAVCWRMQGYTPQRVSNHATENAWQNYSTVTDAIAYSYQDRGHLFYVLYFPTGNATWIYDAATGMWHERSFLDPITGKFSAHRSQCHVFAFGKHLVGDWASGNIYQMSINFADDSGNEIQRMRRAPHISSEEEWIFHSQLQVDLEPAVLPPTIPPTNLTLVSPNGTLWNVFVTDAGLLQTVQGSINNAQAVILNNPGNTVSWQLGVTNAGLLTTTSVTFNAANPKIATIASLSGNAAWDIGVTTPGLLTTTADNLALTTFQPQLLDGAGNVRGPIASIRWSDDGGHTWSNFYQVDCGKIGQFKTRAMWRRMGRSRDRVYELTCSDPVPWRVVDAYLQASPGYAPTERLTAQLRKSA